ncbi:Ger(x)C family spore germination protein [Sporosarcina sp. ACRSM]|uniref:Ger(x)C family spore germination protein n=1 Tax=Sporosarcina sp. ACRSM TaxID=2918216 RepID=UPI001EF4683E|nr:Ger(x)C family spore germination protein [Sporosarcina sp. ACRSM]
MKKIALVCIVCSFLLAGCWDERLYKELTIVPLIGYDGKPGEWMGYFTHTSIDSEDTVSYTTVEGSGISIEDARLNASRKTSESLDPSQILAVLLTEEAVRWDLVETFDVAYRMPRSRLSSKLAVVEGEMAPYMEKTEKMGLEPPNYYDKILATAAYHSIIPDVDIQQAARYILDDGVDLDLPYLKISEITGTPEVAGVALFSGKVFSGHVLDMRESTIVQVLKKKPGKFTVFSYEWENEGVKYPVTVELDRYKKQWEIQKDKIDVTYDVKLDITSFPADHLDEKKRRRELEQFLSKKLTQDFNKVMGKLQEAKSDPIGFGRVARAFHPELWNKGEWPETFSQLDIQVKVKAVITRTGIID